MNYIYENDYCNKYEDILKNIVKIKDWCLDSADSKSKKIIFKTETENKEILLDFQYNDRNELQELLIKIKLIEECSVYTYNFIVTRNDGLIVYFLDLYNKLLKDLVIDLNQKKKLINDIITSFIG